jgi:ribonucleotide monophosphatase NagD (HAD superfamily)
MNKALRLLTKETKLIAMIPGLTDSSLGSLELNVGAWVTILEMASGCKAIYIGKPYPVSLQMTLSTMPIPKEAVIMVGDQIASDIAGAKAAKIRSVLLKQGEFREDHFKLGITPDFQFDSIMELKDKLLVPN